MKILLTGATGLIGKALLPRLSAQGHSLLVLTREPARAARELLVQAQPIAWSPLSGPPPASQIQGVEAVIHLLGESIAARRWSPEQKRRISDSRVLSTRNLLSALQGLPTLKTLISASATGFYGDRGEELLTENSAAGSRFLAELCQSWETEALALESRIRTVLLRTGMVLSREGGALTKMLPPFQLGLGGPLGSGRQWMSWIHIQDLVSAILHSLEKAPVQGPLNAVSPSPVRNAEFTRALGKALHRPTLFKTPRWALRLALGEMAEAILESQRVLPEKLLKSGFVFEYGTLDSALANLIGKKHE